MAPAPLVLPFQDSTFAFSKASASTFAAIPNHLAQQGIQSLKSDARPSGTPGFPVFYPSEMDVGLDFLTKIQIWNNIRYIIIKLRHLAML
jgi:hypothetical protein